MTENEIFNEINEHIDEITQQTAQGKKLLNELANLHHADIAQILTHCSKEDFKEIFPLFNKTLQSDIVGHLPNSRQALAMSIVNDKQRFSFLENMSMDDLYDLADFTTDEELKHYFSLFRKNDREKVLKLLKLKSNTVGTIMDINVVTFNADISVEKSIQILQRLRPEQELHRTIYITDKKNKLVGHIGIEDLVLHSPKTKMSEFMQKNEFIAKADEDQEDVAQKMRHYHITSAPVVSRGSYFLGAITAENLVDILEEEASEDILRISAMTRLKHTYFETPFFRLFFERGAILIVLMFAESITSFIIGHYEVLLIDALTLFIPMLISTGGNTSTQTSAVVIQGLASGEISSNNLRKFLNREFFMALFLSLVLALAAFVRVFYFSKQSLSISLTVGTSIGTVVMASVLLGSAIPFILRKIGLDPAYAAAPFLATGMDILGLFVYCYVAKLILAI
ncbi:TPA: magnesium transporter [Candidatus Dependentiae bacterium]|nr:MAG: magnesium transporter [candidate division TM6 bacterium GW2011_GWF2_36_131]KKQ03610.1 MAG: magnesium transporter [candidate division TM6 bacterium GW2011_GWE2_36_25]KKQ20113.1 MAG: magnesium transporter [candidate division TM6 bacterium GW2011_GWA2_36_9]HBR70656.1 magnesium transporter [Candidatus Dependentiae bacterium]HCU00276.1 magnesium transporter [Candidatus Dependentiae bacterium]